MKSLFRFPFASLEKAALIFLLMMTFLMGASSAFGQSAGGGVGGDRPKITFISVNSGAHARSHLCKDGETGLFTETRSNDRTMTVLRTCENGRFYPKAAPVILRCKDGQRVKMQEYVDGYQRPVDVMRVCKDGKYYQLREDVVKAKSY